MRTIGLVVAMSVLAHVAMAADSYDLIILNGQVIDGSGGDAVAAAVMVRGDEIVQIGPAPAGATAGRIIDAAGRVVAPGFIDTDMTRSLPENHKTALLAQIPLARLGSAEDVAAAVSYLASAGAGYVTGTVLHVNGGMYMA